MDRVHGATESAAFCRRLDFEPAAGAFDAVFDNAAAGGRRRERRPVRRKLRYAMVGGGRDAFIGAVHRHAMALDGQNELVAGALSSSPEKARASGRDLGLADDRNHGDWQALLADELKRAAPTSASTSSSIVTPNHVHYPVAQAFVDAGFHVVCDKPLVHTSAQAEALVAARRSAAARVFGVTYNYTGYPMVRQAREMVRAGAIGAIRKVIVEYNQGWLATAARRQPATSRPTGAPTRRAAASAGAIGDIGSHAENLRRRPSPGSRSRACAPTSAAFVPGPPRSTTTAACCCASRRRARRADRLADRRRLRERPAPARDRRARHARLAPGGARTSWCTRRIDGPRRDADPRLALAERGGAGAPAACRPGHPEGFIEAFANVYRRRGGRHPRAASAGVPAADPLEADYPRMEDGARGVRFIETHRAVGRQRAEVDADG